MHLFATLIPYCLAPEVYTWKSSSINKFNLLKLASAPGNFSVFIKRLLFCSLAGGFESQLYDIVSLTFSREKKVEEHWRGRV